MNSSPDQPVKPEVIDAQSPIHYQMLESKNQRKKAEEDVQTLQNRIKLLQMEENKVNKKIEETKKKTSDIQTAQDRNKEHQAKKAKEAQKRE
jgi:hypothetical protein